MRRRTTSARGPILLLVSVLVTTACGSTVQDLAGGAGNRNGASAAGAGGEGLSLSPSPLDAVDGAAGVGAGLDGGTAVGSTGERTGPSAASGASRPDGSGVAAGGAAGSATRGAVPVGPGVTATTVAVGITYCNDCAAGNAALGAGGESPGDTRRYYQAALDDVNARGGVLGRTLVPVFHEGSANDPSLDAAEQAACETFTTDNKVLIMGGRGNVALECAKKAGIMVLGAGSTGPTYERYPNLFAPANIRLERLYGATVRAMVQAGWHKPDATWPTGRIGLITWEDNQYQYAMEKGFLAALSAAGLKETDVRSVAVPQSASSIADASAAISSAVLAFRQRGIDHVFIGDGPAGVFLNAGLTLLFLQNAKSQGYYPRYAFNSNNDPNLSAHPKDQLVGMLAITSSNADPASDEGISPNPIRERCLALMRKKGLPVGDGQTRGYALDACGIAFFTEAVLTRATAGTTLPQMIAAAESLGTSYRAPSSYGNRLAPGQHDGAALFRALRFDESCSCIAYTSTPFEP